MTGSATRGRLLVVGMLAFLWFNIVGSQALMLARTGRSIGAGSAALFGIIALILTIGLWRGARWVRRVAIGFFALCGLWIGAWAWRNWPEMRAQGVSRLAFASMIAIAATYLLSAGLLWRSAAVAAFGDEMRTRAADRKAAAAATPA